jgi:hypothetical protein
MRVLGKTKVYAACAAPRPPIEMLLGYLLNGNLSIRLKVLFNTARFHIPRLRWAALPELVS